MNIINKKFNILILAAIVNLIFADFLSAEESLPIADNSFLIEEAYNQEEGVVQHINTFFYNWDNDTWDYTFTQEWPLFSQSHQLSYTIPISKTPSPDSETDLADIMINYRYQLINKDDVSASPRFSFILPTGDTEKDLGTDALGYELAFPLSIKLTNKIVNHWNIGYQVIPDAENSSGTSETISSNFFGTSFIYLLSANFNLMLEIAGRSDDVIGEQGSDNSLFINPGVRGALNFNSGLQIVPGLSFPIGINESEGEYGVFFYLSFEHPVNSL